LILARELRLAKWVWRNCDSKFNSRTFA
jgi:hypothetical protein